MIEVLPHIQDDIKLCTNPNDLSFNLDNNSMLINYRRQEQTDHMHQKTSLVMIIINQYFAEKAEAKWQP